jgi:hypothetical protein
MPGMSGWRGHSAYYAPIGCTVTQMSGGGWGVHDLPAPERKGPGRFRAGPTSDAAEEARRAYHAECHDGAWRARHPSTMLGVP